MTTIIGIIGLVIGLGGAMLWGNLLKQGIEKSGDYILMVIALIIMGAGFGIWLVFLFPAYPEFLINIRASITA